jgi:hypothetical protein
MFPGFVSGGDPRIQMATPFVTSFTLPPIFPSGSRGVIELELERNFQTGGVTFDFSTRKFQIPVVFVNLYDEYVQLRFNSNSKNTGILDDADKDGYNNLNEWILDSRAEDANSIPEAPVATSHAVVVNDFGFLIRNQYYGFTVTKKRNTRPAVKYTLERSVNKGVTWKKMVSNTSWTVTETADDIRVESNYNDGNIFNPTQTEPPGTAGHLYRVKITLAK